MRMRAWLVVLWAAWARGDVCLEHEARCADLACVAKDRLCDGRPDCRDLSDERALCRRLERGDCPPGQLACATTRECVPAGWLCDRTHDCADHSDELRCGAPRETEYRWSDVDLVDELLLRPRRRETFQEFGEHVARKLRLIGYGNALVAERIVNEVFLYAQLGLLTINSTVCNPID